MCGPWAIHSISILSNDLYSYLWNAKINQTEPGSGAQSKWAMPETATVHANWFLTFNSCCSFLGCPSFLAPSLNSSGQWLSILSILRTLLIFFRSISVLLSEEDRIDHRKKERFYDSCKALCSGFGQWFLPVVISRDLTIRLSRDTLGLCRRMG